VRPLNPLLAPLRLPSLIERAFDDLHALAMAAPRVTAAVEMLDRLDARAEELLKLGQRIDRRTQAMLKLGERIDASTQAMLQVGADLDERGAALLALGAEVNEIGRQMLPEARLVHARAGEVVEQAADLVAVLPTLRRAVELGEPLEGAIARLGRVVDRLPGEVRARRRVEETGAGDSAAG
jgi:hypothetical protein